MKNRIAKVLVLCVILTMVCAVPTYAATPSNNFNVTEINNNKYLIEDNNNSSIVSINENSNEMIFTIESLESKEDVGFFTIDKLTGNMYSSFTGNTVNISDAIVMDSGFEQNESANLLSAVTVEKTSLCKVSYAKLYELCGKGATLTNVATAIIAIITFTGIGGAAITVAGIVASLAGIGLSNIQKGIASKSKTSGIEVFLVKQKITRHQGGRVVTGYKYTISSKEYKL